MPKCVLAISLSILLLPSLVFAQASSATLSGTIKDTSGGVLPGVSIEARNIATNETRSAVSESTGLYRLTNLPRGTYAVKKSAAAMAPAIGPSRGSHRITSEDELERELPLARRE